MRPDGQRTSRRHGSFGKAEVNRKVAGGGVPDTARDGSDLTTAARGAADFGADGRAIAPAAGQAHLQPMSGWIIARRAIPPQFDGRIQSCDRGVDAAIPIEVGEDHATVHCRLLEFAAHRIGDVFEAPGAVTKDAIGLRVLASSPPPATNRSSHPSLSRSTGRSPSRSIRGSG